MALGDIMALLGGSGGAVGIIMLALFITGHIVPRNRVEEEKQLTEQMRDERNEWKAIADLERQRADVERQRADAGVLAGQIARDIVISLRKEITP